MSTITTIHYTRKDIIDKVADVLREERATVTNIESVVYKAGVDRNEVNATFGSMRGLILEMVAELSELVTQTLEDDVTDRTVRDVLIEFGNQLANTYSVSHLIALYRLALAEVTRHSDMGREFFERGPGRLTVCLAQYLEHSAPRFNQFRLDDPKRVADNFLSLLRDDLGLSDAMTATGTSSARDQTEAVIESVELLCHGIVARGQ